MHIHWGFIPYLLCPLHFPLRCPLVCPLVCSLAPPLPLAWPGLPLYMHVHMHMQAAPCFLTEVPLVCLFGSTTAASLACPCTHRVPPAS